MNEGLLDEAKKTLFRVLAHHPEFRPAQVLSKQLEDLEFKEVFKPLRHPEPKTVFEDSHRVIEELERDLGLELESRTQASLQEQWVAQPASVGAALTAVELYDLGIAFYEMGCYSDALRELNRAEKKIRIQETFLGDLGVAVVALSAQCLIHLGRAFEAKAYLEPIMIEPDLKHEDKLPLYYASGWAEQELGNEKSALNWFKRVAETDDEFKDVNARIAQLQK